MHRVRITVRFALKLNRNRRNLALSVISRASVSGSGQNEQCDDYATHSPHQLLKEGHDVTSLLNTLQLDYGWPSEDVTVTRDMQIKCWITKVACRTRSYCLDFLMQLYKQIKGPRYYGRRTVNVCLLQTS